MKVVRVFLSGHGEQNVVYNDLVGLMGEVEEYWEGAEVNDEDMIIKLTEMPDDEFNTMPEFTGW